MSNTSLTRNKSPFTRRRLIIVFILCTIMTVGIVTGFTGDFFSDPNIYTPNGERVVMFDNVPTSGTPNDYDLVSNVKYTAQKLYMSSYFGGETIGKVVANVGMGIKYTQNVHNTRVVKGKEIFSEAISSSSLKSVAEQKYILGDVVLYRAADKISGNSATFVNSASKLSIENYYAAYGVKPNELSKYNISESTILSVIDENAVGSSNVIYAAANTAATADESNAPAYEVPSNLVADENGHYKVTLVLDPTASTKYYRNEVRTLAGADQSPVFYTVKITITIDEKWNPVSTETYEVYDIAIPVLGAMQCTATMKETFYDIGKADGVVPEQDFFMQHLDADETDNGNQQLSPADYLATAFASYLDGSKNLCLSADVAIDGLAIKDIDISVNIASMDIAARIGKLTVQYSGDRVYLTLNNIKGYLSTAKFAELMQNEAVSGLLGGLELPDFSAILGGDILSTVFGNCEMTTTDGIVCIHLPFELSGIGIDASLYINDEDKTLSGIQGVITAFGKTISIAAEPVEFTPPAIDDGYSDLSGAVDYIAAALNTVQGNTSYRINGNIAFNDTAIGIDAYLNTSNGIAAEAVISVLGTDVTVKYLNDTIYAEIGGIKLKATIAELPELIATVQQLLGIDMSQIAKYIKMFIPSDIQGILALLDSVQVTDEAFNIGLKVLACPINLTLEKSNDMLSGIALDMNMNILGLVSFTASADLDISVPESREITCQGDYTPVTDLVELIDSIMPYVQADGLSLVADATIGIGTQNIIAGLNADIAYIKSDNSISGVNAAADIRIKDRTLKVTYFNDIIYAALNDIKIKSSASALGDIISAATSALGVSLSNGSINVNDILSNASLTVKDGELRVTVNLSGNRIDIIFNPVTGALSLNVEGSITAQVNGTLRAASGVTVSAPSDAADYADASALIPTMEKIGEIINAGGVSGTITAVIANETVNMNYSVDLSGSPIITVICPEYAMNLTFSDGTLFISAGELAVYADISEFSLLVEALSPVLPQYIIDLLSMNLEQIIDCLIDVVSGVTTNNNEFTIGLGAGDITAAVGIKTDLSHIGFTANALALGDVSVTANTVLGGNATTPNKSQYSNILNIARVIPTLISDTYSAELDLTALGVNITGTVYAELKNGIALKADLTVADVPVSAAYIDNTVYLSLNNSIKLQAKATKAQLESLITELNAVLPSPITLPNDIQMNIGALIKTLISCISEFSADPESIVLGIETDKLGGATLHVQLSANSANGTAALTLSDCTIAGYEFSGKINLDMRAQQSVNVTAAEYTHINTVAQYIRPLVSLVDSAKTAKTITLNLNAFALTSSNTQTRIGGSITVSLENGIAIDALITLFNDTASAQDMRIIFTQNVLYIEVGNIKLNFDASTDIRRIYDVLAGYLPDYLDLELGKLLGLEQGASAFSDLSLIIERIKDIASTTDLNRIISLLFSEIGGLSSDSAAKTLLDMVTIRDNNGGIALSLTVMGITLDIKPVLNGNQLASVTIDTNISVADNLHLQLGVTSFTLSDAATAINAPADAADYVSIAEFVEMINNAVTTFTTTDADGNITFEITTLDVAYDKKATDTAEAQRITVKNVNGKSALKGKFIRNETMGENGEVAVSYLFNLEAHIILSMSASPTLGDITLDLYVINDGSAPGAAYLSYYEGATGFGERISIDYESIMQILAAAMDIIGIKDETVEALLGDYRLNIDSSIFDSMDIVGLDGIKTMLDDLVVKIDDFKNALASVTKAVDLINTAGSIEVLKTRLDDIEFYLSQAISALGINLGTNVSAASATDAPVFDADGSMFKKIVNGVTLKKDASHLWADVDNSITTGAAGTANVTVTQNNSVIDSITIANLDADTAFIDGSVHFTAGQTVDITVPAEMTQTTGNTQYSNLANIKHLLFDIMNTANLKEFEIGNGSDMINLNVKIIGIQAVSVSIPFNVKVKLIDQGEGAVPRYKAAAAVEIVFNDCTALSAVVVPNCTTRLYFYDNMLYISGREWYKTGTNWLGQTKWGQRDVNVSYTLDEFTNTIATDMNKFCYEFLFYLLPLSRDFTFVKVDMQSSIVDAISKDGTSAASPTLAKVFKGYSYGDGNHKATIGLAELAGDKNLSDLVITLGGKNDSDDNILDNYVSTAGISTSFVSMVNLSLNATLVNAQAYTDPTDNIVKLRSTGLSDTTVRGTVVSLENMAQVIAQNSWTAIWAA